MKITVTIITRNRADQLARCLRSLCKQIDPDFKVLIVDNGSTDNTKDTINTFKKRLKITYFFEGHPGASYARNKALKVITGDVMATMDDDCEAFPSWIREIKKAHKEFPEAFAVQGYAISRPKYTSVSILAQFNHDSGMQSYLICPKPIMFYFTDQFLSRPNPILLIDAKNSSFKLALLKKWNFTFNSSRKYAEDFEFSRQILAKGEKIIFYPSIVVYHWERTKFLQFIGQRVRLGAEIMNARMKWPKKTFPDRSSFWWIGKGMSFAIYLVRKGYYRKFLTLISLFAIEKSLYIFARYREYVKLKFR